MNPEPSSVESRASPSRELTAAVARLAQDDPLRPVVELALEDERVVPAVARRILSEIHRLKQAEAET